MKRLTARQYATAIHAAWLEASPDRQPQVVRTFLELLNRRRAMKLLPRIMDQVQALEHAASGRTHVRVWTAGAADTAHLQGALDRALGQAVIEAETDPKLLGGLKIHIGDRLIDGTVRSRLERLHTHLTEST